jgi:REP element-mobilizing transposase RayT
MSTYTQIIFQIVFGTKYRERILLREGRTELFQYINGLLVNKNCHVYRINGVEDHLHIVTHLHPSVSLASLVKDVKLATSDHIKKTNLFPKFIGWQSGYGAFTYTIKEKDRLIEYVKNQEEHHAVKTFIEEYIQLMVEHGIQFDEKYLL